MKIGYIAEGWVDKGFLHGMQKRLCPGAELIEGHYRGTSGLSLRREYDKSIAELEAKRVDLVTVLTDANDGDWRERIRSETKRLPARARERTVLGVPQRNIECWICADAAWIAGQLGRQASDFEITDPSGAFKNAVAPGDWRRVRDLVTVAPMTVWYKKKACFAHYYDALRAKGRQLFGCEVENLRDASQANPDGGQ